MLKPAVNIQDGYCTQGGVNTMQVVAHNLESQFSNRHLNVTSKEKAKSTEKLSSGYRINRSADDAAGPGRADDG